MDEKLLLKAEYWHGYLDGKLAGLEEAKRMIDSPGYALGMLLKLSHPDPTHDPDNVKEEDYDD